ncbi:hypothetical protein, partial [Kitasatospora sp. NPDC127116]|uniref:hypothetical protein n=1 Tax=Kitasatospora sp. NPDC127116 TaxID=3345367 RepID=UPI00363C10F8
AVPSSKSEPSPSAHQRQAPHPPTQEHTVTDQPADLLAAAAQRIRQGDRRIDITLRDPLAALFDDAEHRIRSVAQAAAEVWPEDPCQQAEFTARQQPDAILAFARAVLGRDGGQQ